MVAKCELGVRLLVPHRPCQCAFLYIGVNYLEALCKKGSPLFSDVAKTYFCLSNCVFAGAHGCDVIVTLSIPPLESLGRMQESAEVPQSAA